MDVKSRGWFLQVLLLVHVVVGKRRPSSYSQYQGGESCTFSYGQFCRDQLEVSTETASRDGWRLRRAQLITQEYYASISCQQQCEDSLTVLRNLEGSQKSVYLSFYYNIWEPSNSSVSSPSLSIASCGSSPNLVSNEVLNDYSNSTWRGAVTSLHCTDTFNITFVAKISSPDHMIAVDNIALTYGFSIKGILSQPSYNITSPLGITDNPATTGKMPPHKNATSVTPGNDSSATIKPFVTDTSSEDVIPLRTFALSGTYGVSIDNHAAFTPVMILTFISIICTTTIVIHVLICKNQRRISSRLRRASATFLSPPTEQRKSSPDLFVTSYSSSHQSEPRTVSFVSRNDLDSHNDEDAKPTTHRELKRRVSIACVENVSKTSPLRPHGRAYTTPAKPNDALYESIDGTSLKPGLESGPKRFLRKLSPSRLPRLLDNTRWSISDLQKKEKSMSNSSSLLSVTVDPNARSSEKLNSARLTPPLPPRTYSVHNESQTKKSNSSPQLIPKKTVTFPRLLENLNKDDTRRWSDVVTKCKCDQEEGDISKSECEYHILESGSPESIKAMQEHAENHLSQTDLHSPEHRYYVLESGSTEESDTDFTGSMSMTGEGAIKDDSDHRYHVLENSSSLPLEKCCTLEKSQCTESSSLTESNTYQSLQGSLGSHHTYQSLDNQSNLDYGSETAQNVKHKDSSSSCVAEIRANVYSTKSEGNIGVNRFSREENHGYSIPLKRKSHSSGPQCDRSIDKNAPLERKEDHFQEKESFVDDKYCSLRVSSEHSEYTQLQARETNLTCEVDDTESAGGYDHVQK